MKNGKEMLSSIVRVSQLRQSGIRSALESAMGPGLRKTLEAQLQEFGRIEDQALYLASQRGWDLPEADPASRYFAALLYRTRLNRRKNDAKIAGLMIRRNTKDMVRGIKEQRQFQKQDMQIYTLNQTLLDCEKVYIRQMQCFL